MSSQKNPLRSAAPPLLALLALAITPACTSSKKASQIANEPALPGETLEFFGRGTKLNHFTPSWVNRESYAPKYESYTAPEVVGDYYSK